MRLLCDILSMFAVHGYLSINWLEGMAHTSIDHNSSKILSSLWEFENKAILQDFYKPVKTITINNILEIWKTD
jgi:hypothetical protein